MTPEGDVQYRQRSTLAATTIVLILSNTAYALRIYARRTSKQKIGADDMLMGAALVISYIPAICNYIGLANGLGRHQNLLSKEQLRHFFIATFILEKAWSLSLGMVKISILLCYKRLFPTPIFRKIVYCFILYTCIWVPSAFIGNTLQCSPVRYFYDKTVPGGHCIDARKFFIIIGATSFVEDISILALPLPMVWNLKISKRRKIGLTFTFLLGGFVCVTSLLRLTSFKEIVNSDYTYTNTWPGLWTCIELDIGVVCGCLPLLRPIFWRFSDARPTPKSYSSEPNSSGSSKRLASPVTLYSRSDGFERMLEPEGSNASGKRERLGDNDIMIEMLDQQPLPWIPSKGILVQKDVDLKSEDRRDVPQLEEDIFR